ncbi:MAG: cytochrome c [Bdellovibrionaceae bacterium]|nr:cytochrome c [Bdellovibrionales bacterium]MCB9085064.1 cytochrome c [Pseudobdellovibrionaceae bacterium]
MRKSILVALLFVLSPLAMAKEPAKLAVCAACHGKNGVGTQGKYPNLAGQHKEYLVSALNAYKEGKRDNAEMKPMAAMLTPADIEELATYFSGLKK